MPIRVRGCIVIERRKGRHGDFNTGDLATEIGQFEVKDALIEEFEPGRYEGEFLIKWIEPDSFSWRGKVFVKVRAQLDAFFIDTASDDAPTPAAPPEPDPIEHGTPPIRVAIPEAQPADESPFDAGISAQVAAGAAVRLDPTVDRQVFRLQRDRLKALGYSFDAKAQTWLPGAA